MFSLPLGLSANAESLVQLPGTALLKPGNHPAATSPMPDGTLLVTVAPPGGIVETATLGQASAVESAVKSVDPVSRLCFLNAPAGEALRQARWASTAGANQGTVLRAGTPQGLVGARGAGWAHVIGGKVLPFALMRVEFEGSVPVTGTPLLNPAGDIVGIVFQGTGAANSAYAIAAETVHRVHRDVRQHGQLVRGWLGLSLKPEAGVPEVVRIWPDSPAEAAGIRAGDVLQAIGTRPITSYADAANAFFYLVPGEAVRVKLRRGGESLDFPLVPTHARPD